MEGQSAVLGAQREGKGRKGTERDRREVRAEKGPREAGLEEAVVSLPRAYGLACQRMPSAEMAARARTCGPYRVPDLPGSPFTTAGQVRKGD